MEKLVSHSHERPKIRREYKKKKKTMNKEEHMFLSLKPSEY